METIKKYIKLVPYLIILGLIIALCVNQCTKQKLKHEVKTIPDSTDYFKGKLAAKEREEQALKQKWAKDSLEMKARENRFKQVATKAKRERDIARGALVGKEDTIPAVKDFIEKDSVSDNILIARIREQELEKVQITEACRARLDVATEQIEIGKELVAHVESVNNQLEKDLNRERVKKTVWKVVASVIGAVLLFEVVQD